MVQPEEELPSANKEEQSPEGEAQSGPARMEALKAELEESERERTQFKVMAQRAQADLVNFRRRVEEEREETVRSIAASVITRLLPILDDLRLALDRPHLNAEQGTWLDGFRLIQRRLQNLIESEGVTPIEAEGKVFNPWEHEALYAVEDAGKQAGTVAAVIRPGYKLYGKILRAAQVAVVQGRKPEQAQPADEEKAGNSDQRED